MLGLSDGGAHCGVICDASLNTTMLAHWVRDRTRGPRLPLEYVVKRQTSDTADFFGFRDRGRLRPGLKADVNVIDFDGLRLHAPQMIFDLPAGGRRLVQHVDGYDMTICSGTPIFEKGEETGARPGQAGALGRLTGSGRRAGVRRRLSGPACGPGLGRAPCRDGSTAAPCRSA